jgi:hypothetical protein
MSRINDRTIQVNKLPFTEFSRPPKELKEALKEQPTRRTTIETKPLSNEEFIGLLLQPQNTFTQSTEEYLPKSQQFRSAEPTGGRNSRRYYI